MTACGVVRVFLPNTSSLNTCIGREWWGLNLAMQPANGLFPICHGTMIYQTRYIVNLDLLVILPKAAINRSAHFRPGFDAGNRGQPSNFQNGLG